MKELLITILRDRTTPRSVFRHSATELGYILVDELVSYLPHETVAIETPLASAFGKKLKYPVVLVPILRSGLALLPPFLEFFSDARVGCVGLRRDEETAKPKLYYLNTPIIEKNDRVIILDPMIATGGSGSAAIKILIEQGIEQDRIFFVAVIASKQGIATIRQEFPGVTFLVAQVDPILNAKSFIEPGLGDFGDRYFGTV